MTEIKGLKFDEAKVRVDLLPYDPLYVTAKVLTFGAQKYGDYNWANGIHYHRLFRAAINHTWQWFKGNTNDPETGLPHLAHAICCLLFLLHYDLYRKQYANFDDRPITPTGPKKKG